MNLNKEDLRNIDGWITATSMMIEAKARVPWRESEFATFKKLDHFKMATWPYGERICLICGRFAYPTDYYPPDFMETNKHMVVPLCQYHKGNYMAHGLKALDEMYSEGYLEQIEALPQSSEQEAEA